VKCEVFDEQNQLLGSQVIRLTKNVNKTTNTSTYGSNYGVVNFYAQRTGTYRFRWTPCADQWGGAGNWLEIVFGHIKISQGQARAREASFDDGETTAVSGIESADVQDDAWYTLSGQRVGRPTKGLYIHNGKKVMLR
jgi:hypothetical protein